jgi:hypothetical protein
MLEWLSRLRVEELIPLAGMTFTLLVVMIVTIGVTELQADLKRQMLGLGMSAADIEKVLQAPAPDGWHRGSPA